MEDLFTPAEAAAWLGVSPSTLAQWRYSNEGPEYVRVSPRRVRYTEAGLLAYKESRTKRSTADALTRRASIA